MNKLFSILILDSDIKIFPFTKRVDKLKILCKRFVPTINKVK